MNMDMDMQTGVGGGGVGVGVGVGVVGGHEGEGEEGDPDAPDFARDLNLANIAEVNEFWLDHLDGMDESNMGSDLVIDIMRILSNADAGASGEGRTGDMKSMQVWRLVGVDPINPSVDELDDLSEWRATPSSLYPFKLLPSKMPFQGSLTGSNPVYSMNGDLLLYG